MAVVVASLLDFKTNATYNPGKLGLTGTYFQQIAVF